MKTSLEWVGDTVESSWLGKRDKNLHTVGVVASVKYVPVPNNEGYTGVFEGADHGVIRFSTGPQPDYTRKNASQAFENFGPGFALKLLRDGVVSANILTLTP